MASNVEATHDYRSLIISTLTKKFFLQPNEFRHYSHDHVEFVKYLCEQAKFMKEMVSEMVQAHGDENVEEAEDD